jgi:hypothetical protein
VASFYLSRTDNSRLSPREGVQVSFCRFEVQVGYAEQLVEDQQGPVYPILSVHRLLFANWVVETSPHFCQALLVPGVGGEKNVPKWKDKREGGLHARIL